MSPSTTLSPFTGTYSIDPVHSSVGFAVRHMGVSTFRGSFAQLDGSLAVMDDGALKLTGTAEARSISIVSPIEFHNHVLGEDFFDVERHPAIVFESDPAHPSDDGTITVEGRLTIRNVTHPLLATGTWSAPVEDPYGNQRAAIELTATVDRRDYGMTWNASLPKGGDALGTDVTLTVHLELVGD